MSLNFSDINFKNIDETWLLTFLRTGFDNPNENITALKILSKLGIAIHNQTMQLDNKDVIQKINSLLKILNEKHLLEVKNNLHDTLGIKETAYKLKPKK